MKVLYVSSSIKKWDFKVDTTPLMIKEVRKRNGKTYFCEASDIFIKDNEVFSYYNEIILKKEFPFYVLSERICTKLTEFDVIHLRVDPPFDIKYYYTTIYLEMVSDKVLVINDPVSVRKFNEKLSIFNFPDFITETIVTSNLNDTIEFVEKVGNKVVAKDLSECSSKGVFLVEGSKKEIIIKLEEIFSKCSGQVMFQKFIPEVINGETRITMINGKPVGIMKKIPEKGSFLASLSFNATTKKCELTEKDIKLCNSVGKFLKENRIFFAALDVINSNLSEMNITSPGLMYHTNKIMNIKLEEIFEDIIEEELSNLYVK